MLREASQYAMHSDTCSKIKAQSGKLALVPTRLGGVKAFHRLSVVSEHVASTCTLPGLDIVLSVILHRRADMCTLKYDGQTLVGILRLGILRLLPCT